MTDEDISNLIEELILSTKPYNVWKNDWWWYVTPKKNTQRFIISYHTQQIRFYFQDAVPKRGYHLFKIMDLADPKSIDEIKKVASGNTPYMKYYV